VGDAGARAAGAGRVPPSPAGNTGPGSPVSHPYQPRSQARNRRDATTRRL